MVLRVIAADDENLILLGDYAGAGVQGCSQIRKRCPSVVSDIVHLARGRSTATNILTSDDIDVLIGGIDTAGEGQSRIWHGLLSDERGTFNSRFFRSQIDFKDVVDDTLCL